MNSISCLIAQLTVTLGQSALVCFSRPCLFQTCSFTLSQMLVVVFSESAFHVGSLSYPPDIFYN